jgi:hypothetical protein
VESYLPTKLMELLLISIVFSFILMSLIQKFKILPLINKDWHVWALDLVLSFLIGIPFSIIFYNLSIPDSLWVALFGFIGAPTLYEAIKNQGIININLASLNDSSISIPKENEIKK